MTPERWEEIGHLYEQALSCPPEYRAALLDQVCADDPELRREVESLIATYEAEPEFLEESTFPLLGEASSAWDEAAERENTTHIGPYRLVRPLGRGGMGEVFLAVRDLDAVQQAVALKLLRPGLEHDDLLRRFTTEQQILAQLTHPRIARLLDAGQAEDGRPYLAMEYVDGEPITIYCDHHDLTTEQRLRLFMQVCEAVQFAHRHLVIHRDLKPSNILVTREGEVKLLDFGIAKMLDPIGMKGSLLQTQTGRQLLTPAYASPEQIEGAPIATTSDVYSLGVLFHELLTGRRPSTEGVPEHEPPRLRGDLDVIVQMALREEPERRYASASDLADDLRRYLDGLPVRARADTLGYRTRKFVRRNRWAVAAAAAFVLLLTGFAGAMTWQQAATARERDRAERELAKSETVTDFMMDLFAANHPSEALGDTITARQLLERGLERMEALEDQPEIQTRMLDLIGRIYKSLGEYDKADPLLEQALVKRRRLFGEVHEDVATSLNHLAGLRTDQGRYEEATRLAQESLALQRTLGSDEHAALADNLNLLATLHKHQGEYDEAEQRFRELIALERDLYGEDDMRLGRNLYNLGRLLDAKLDYAASLEAYREALAIHRENLGPEDPNVIIIMNGLGLALSRTGRHEEAEQLLRDVVALRRKILGPAHPGLATSLVTLALPLNAQGKASEAVETLTEALAIYREAQGAEHPNVAATHYNLARVLHRAGEFETAEAHFRTALTMRRKLLGREHPSVALTAMFMGRLLHDQEAYAEAESLYLEALAIAHDKMGADHKWTRDIRQWLVELYETLNMPEKADAHRLSLSVEPEPAGQ